MFKTALLSFILFLNFNLFSQSIYKVQPDVSACQEGELTDAEKEKVQNYVNRIRAIHHIPPVTYDYSGDKFAQKGALVTVANRSLSHTPPSNWSCFSDDAYYGNENSNLYIYMSSMQTQLSSENGIINWMIDENVENLGHRRAIINPFVDKISFGRVEGTVAGAYVIGMNLKYLDNVKGNISATNIEYVAYPQGEYDKDYFQNGWYLSFHVISDKVNWWNNNKIDYSTATISVKDASGNSIGVNSISFDNEGWGALTNMIKWKCSTLKNYETYTVEIKNVKFNGNFKNYTYTFVLGDGPVGDITTPSLLIPENQATNVKVNQEFSWTDVDDSYLYNIQISDKSDFSNIIDVKNNIDGNTYVSTKLGNEITYYWRVQSVKDGAKGSWSKTSNFTTEKYTPKVPALISPTSKELTFRIKPYFQWENVNDKFTYDLQVGDRPTFSLKLVDQTGLTSNTFNSIDANLKPNKTYYWKVRSNDGSMKGEWSETYEFTTPDLPVAPMLLSPGNDNGTMPIDDWIFISALVDNATDYKFIIMELNQDGDEVNKYDFENSSNTFILKRDAVQNREKLNAWKVTSLNSGLEGGTSKVFRFNASTTSVESKELNKNLVSVYPNPIVNKLNIEIVDNSFLNSQFYIVGLDGNQLLSGKLVNNQTELNLEKLNSGVYFIVIDNNNNKYYQKVIKK